MVRVKKKKTAITIPTTTAAARCFTTLILQLYILLTISVVSSFFVIHIYSLIHKFQGTIYFHHIKESDFKPNRYYTCTAENTKLRDYKFGNQFRLDVTKNRRRACKTFVFVSFFFLVFKIIIKFLLEESCHGI